MNVLHLPLVPIAVLLTCLAVSRPASATSQCAPLQERMSYAHFRKLGLDQLSKQQLKGLNAWFAAHGSCGKKMSDTTENSASTEPPKSSTPFSGPVHSRIAGKFNGWNKDTVLILKNGQHWRVTDDTPMHIATLQNPRVTVRKGLFNAWLLSIKGLSQTAHVAAGN